MGDKIVKDKNLGSQVTATRQPESAGGSDSLVVPGIDASVAEVLTQAMQRAVDAQQQMQAVTTTSVAEACARLLGEMPSSGGQPEPVSSSPDPAPQPAARRVPFEPPPSSPLETPPAPSSDPGHLPPFDPAELLVQNMGETEQALHQLVRSAGRAGLEPDAETEGPYLPPRESPDFPPEDAFLDQDLADWTHTPEQEPKESVPSNTGIDPEPDAGSPAATGPPVERSAGRGSVLPETAVGTVSLQQCLAQTSAIALQDAVDHIRNVSTIATTAMGVAMSHYLTSGDPRYAAVIDKAQEIVAQAARNLQIVSQQALSVMNTSSGASRQTTGDG